MVIGNGLVARKFFKYSINEDVVIFASGVSNSKLTVRTEFERERQLLIKTIEENSQKMIVYFSSCSLVSDVLKNDAYHTHKRNMENLIKQKANKFLIFRLSNVIGLVNNNSNTIVHFFVKQTIKSEPFNVWKGSMRNLIDIDDVYTLCNHIIQHNFYQNETINIANPNNISVELLVDEIGTFLNLPQMYTFVEKKEELTIDISKIKLIIKKEKINFDNEYLKRLLKKYYKNYKDS